MKRRQQAVTAIFAAIPGLLLAAATWLNAQAKAAEARKAWDGYGEYVTDQLKRDEALVAALQDCLDEKRLRAYERLARQMQSHLEGEPAGAIVGMVKPDTRQADEILNDVARSRGWEPGGVK